VNIDQEKRIVELMIRLYCRKSEGNQQLCEKCKALLEYAHLRLTKCKYGDDKPTCRICPIHCYRPDMRKQMQYVMRFSGPRMVLYHPLDTIRHIWKEIKPKSK
jgi:hypothetical protein